MPTSSAGGPAATTTITGANQPSTSAASGTVEPPTTSHQQMFRRGRVTTPNTYAAQLRVINNVRMQRACRYSIKKLHINSIVDTSNYQRLVSGVGGPEFAAIMAAGAPPADVIAIKPPTDKATDKPGSTIIAIGLPGKSKRGNGAGAGPGAAGSAGVGGIGASNIGVNVIDAAGVVIPQQQQRPNPIMINASIFPGSGNSNDIDFKIFQYKKQQAELKRNQLEDDLKVAFYLKLSY